MAQEKSTRRVTKTAASQHTELKNNDKTKKDEPNFYVCPTCGHKYSKLDSNFPASQSELYAGWDYHIPICRTCLDKIFIHYTTVYGGDEDKAIRRICEKFDIYYNVSLLNASRKITKTRSRIHNYISKANLVQYKNKTFDTTLDEERNNTISSIEDYDEKKLNGEVSTTKTALKRWGVGVFADTDYSILEEHYKMLKDNNPNADNNQEIFIKSLCNLNMLMVKALQSGDSKEYANLVEQYAKTFKQAGLRTIEEKDDSNSETFGVTLATISQYTPEEFYKDKQLYEDWDELGDYYDRHICRPMKNLMFDEDVRDKEFYVPDGDIDEDDE